MCNPLCEAIQSGKTSESSKERQKWAALEAAISHFIEGGKITEDQIKQLLPQKYEHWELRSPRPRPSMRVFGRFARPDVFVGTHVKLRSELGGMWSSEFEHEKLVCEQYWEEAELSKPFTDSPGFRYNKYITYNASKKVRVKP